MDNFYVETSISTDGVNYPSVSLYFFGCDKPVKCHGCHNEKLWSFPNQKDNVQKMIAKMEDELNKIYKYSKKVSICFLGGEPLANQHIGTMEIISKYFKEKYNNVITIVYTWRTIEDIIHRILSFFNLVHCQSFIFL